MVHKVVQKLKENWWMRKCEKYGTGIRSELAALFVVKNSEKPIFFTNLMAKSIIEGSDLGG